MASTTYTDIFTRFQQRLTSAGGQSHLVANLAEATAVIASHPALMASEIVVPPNFDQHQQWGAILPLLSYKGITIHEVRDPASVARCSRWPF